MRAFLDRYIGPIFMSCVAIAAIVAFIALLRWDPHDYKTPACKRIMEVGLGTTFNKHNKFHMQTCMAGLDQVEQDFDDIDEPKIAKAFFECLAVGESEADFEFCHEFKSRRLFQEHYRISRDEADE